MSERKRGCEYRKIGINLVAEMNYSLVFGLFMNFCSVFV